MISNKSGLLEKFMASNPPDHILTARQHVPALNASGVGDPKRVLLAMLDHLPQPGLENIAADINACADSESISQLSEHYVSTVFKPYLISFLGKAIGRAFPPLRFSPEYQYVFKSPIFSFTSRKIIKSFAGFTVKLPRLIVSYR